MHSALRIVFAGTPEFASISLAALLDSDHKVVAVYTQPDRPAGRGRKLTAGPVKQLAQQHGIPVYQPASLKGAEEQQTLKSLKPDVLIVVAYGLILPQAVLDIPRYGCFNVHASLLPRWRGAAPIQRAILAGDEQTGVTIMQMDAGLDTGDMLMRIPTPILVEDNGQSLHDRLAELGANALILTLSELQMDRLQPVPQNDEDANYAAKLDKSEALIDWQQPAPVIWNKIRAFNPWPVAYTRYHDEPLRIWQAQVLDQVQKLNPETKPGSVIAQDKRGIDVATGAGVLRITQLQLPGKRAMQAQDFINAHDLTGIVF